MLSRRGFVRCALCAITAGFAATEVAAQNQPAPAGGVTRKILNTTEMPDGKTVVIQVSVEVAVGATVARHTHPGIESAFVLTGEGELLVEGRPAQSLKANDTFQVPPGVPHSLTNGSQPTRLAVTYIVEKDKPLLSPA